MGIGHQTSPEEGKINWGGDDPLTYIKGRQSLDLLIVCYLVHFKCGVTRLILYKCSFFKRNYSTCWFLLCVFYLSTVFVRDPVSGLLVNIQYGDIDNGTANRDIQMCLGFWSS